MRFCVAIDGPAASGKGTIARAVAAHFGFAHLDTGALYRGVAARIIGAGGDCADPETAEAAARAFDPASLHVLPLRTAEAGEGASKVAAIPAVRAALLELQRDFSRRAGGAVLDGRDIGTVVRPDADVKLFVTADLDARAARRAAELSQPLARVRDDLAKRDARDAGRADAPMRPADDAHLLDTTNLAIDAAVARATALIGKTLQKAQTRQLR